MSEGVKHDAGKCRYDLIPAREEAEVAWVLTAPVVSGKYASENWKKIRDIPSRYYAAARRHMESWRQGEIIDPDDGRHHLAHAICCLLFIMWHDRVKRRKWK